MTHEENELLTHVGPGTPGGELLRRYWFPVATTRDVTAESPTKFEKVQQGLDPIGVMRDLDHDVIDTNHSAPMHEWRGAVTGSAVDPRWPPSEGRAALRYA